MNTPRLTNHPAALEAEALLAQCDVQRTRRSGPGGQHRNKVETAIVLKHRPTGVESGASERRSQSENLREAVFRLRLNLALEVRSDFLSTEETSIAPSAMWQSRCRNRRINVNARHDDFPAVLAEALDAIHRHGPDLHDAAEFLECTRTQLVNFLKIEPRALAAVNKLRHNTGLRRLR
jgi:RF-1 domain